MNKFFKTALFLLLIGTNTLFAQSLFDKGMGYFQNRDYTSAISTFNQALESNNRDAELYFYRGSSYLMLQKPNIALVDFNQCILLNANKNEAYLYRAICHHALKNYTFAEGDYLIYKQSQTNTIEVLKSLIQLMEEMQDYAKAAEYCTEFISQDPNNVTVIKKRALYYLAIDSINLSIKDIDKAIQINKFDTSAWMMKGNIYYDASMFMKAIDAYNVVLLYEPSNLLALLNRADAFMSLQLFEESIRDLRSINMLDPSNTAIYYDLGFCYLQTGQNEKSIFYLTKSLDFEKENLGNILTLRGVAYLNQKMNQEACSDWKKAENIGFKDATKYILNYCK
jgi:tetratricopeptide (TPR) repeat protein